MKDTNEELKVMPPEERRRGVLGSLFLGLVLAFHASLIAEASMPSASAGGRVARGGCTLVGTSDNEVLRGTAGDDVICGLEGNDVLIGGGGDDVLLGGPGADVLQPGAGDDRVWGGSWGDTVSYADSGHAVILNLAEGTARGVGIDKIHSVSHATGSFWDDRLHGDSTRNRLRGHRGDDGIRGMTGPDRLYGNGGDDGIHGGPGADLIDGGPGRDRCVQGSGSGEYQNCP